MTRSEQQQRVLDGSYEEKEEAIDSLVADGSDEALSTIISLIEDPEGVTPDVFELLQSAAVTFGRRALPSILRLLDDDDEIVRFRAAAILEELGDPAATDRLVAALADPYPAVRAFAADALSRIGGAAGQAELERVVETDPDEWVRDRAARALRQQG